MRSIARLFALLILYLPAIYAQDLESTEDVGERLARLESAVATLETQLLARTTTGAGSLGRDSAGLDMTGRVDRLEQRIERLTLDLQRMTQQVDSAAREASEARRAAQTAERTARDAMMRARSGL